MGRKGDQALLLLSQDKGSPNIQLQSVPSVASQLGSIVNQNNRKTWCVCLVFGLEELVLCCFRQDLMRPGLPSKLLHNSSWP